MNLLGQKITLRRILGMIAGVVIIGIGIAVFKFSRLGNDSISALTCGWRSWSACRSASRMC